MMRTTTKMMLATNVVGVSASFLSAGELAEAARTREHLDAANKENTENPEGTIGRMNADRPKKPDKVGVSGSSWPFGWFSGPKTSTPAKESSSVARQPDRRPLIQTTKQDMRGFTLNTRGLPSMPATKSSHVARQPIRTTNQGWRGFTLETDTRLEDSKAAFKEFVKDAIRKEGKADAQACVRWLLNNIKPEYHDAVLVSEIEKEDQNHPLYMRIAEILLFGGQ